MSIKVISKERQAYGAFNGGEIVENKPIGFPREGGETKPYSNLFYWAYAEAKVDSTIGLHPHEGFEIMSFVLNGSIRHYDTKLKEWRALSAGDAQIIRAGNGISHAEHMNKDSVMFQIWVDPNLDKTLKQPASYDDYKSADFPVKEFDHYKVKTYSGDGAPLTMDAPGISIREVLFEQGFEYPLNTDKIYSIYVQKGDFNMNEEKVKQDDFVLVENSEMLKVEANASGKFFVIESPVSAGYKTYAEIMQERMKR